MAQARQPVDRGHIVTRDTVLRFRGGATWNEKNDFNPFPDKAKT